MAQEATGTESSLFDTKQVKLTTTDDNSMILKFLEELTLISMTVEACINEEPFFKEMHAYILLQGSRSIGLFVALSSKPNGRMFMESERDEYPITEKLKINELDYTRPGSFAKINKDLDPSGYLSKIQRSGICHLLENKIGNIFNKIDIFSEVSRIKVLCNAQSDVDLIITISSTDNWKYSALNVNKEHLMIKKSSAINHQLNIVNTESSAEESKIDYDQITGVDYNIIKFTDNNLTIIEKEFAKEAQELPTRLASLLSDNDKMYAYLRSDIYVKAALFIIPTIRKDGVVFMKEAKDEMDIALAITLAEAITNKNAILEVLKPLYEIIIDKQLEIRDIDIFTNTNKRLKINYKINGKFDIIIVMSNMISHWKYTPIKILGEFKKVVLAAANK
jgi:hypothetical protein